MLINEEVKLDYSDVLIRPKRSTMSSRGEVNLERTHRFLWSKKKWKGIPIMSANMDTVGTPAMHKALSKYNLITCPARHYLKKILKILMMVKKIFVGLVALMIYLNYQKFPQHLLC